MKRPAGRWGTAAVVSAVATLFFLGNLIAAADLGYDRDARGLVIARFWGYGAMALCLFTIAAAALAIRQRMTTRR